VKNRGLLVALSAVVVLVGAVALYVQSRTGAGEAVVTPTDDDRPAPGEARVELPEPGTRETAEDAGSARSAETEDTARGVAGIPVTGRVVLPEGMPVDDVPEVVLQVRSSETKRWSLWLERKGLLAEVDRVVVSADGSFSVLAPMGTEPEFARVLLDALTLHLSRPYVIEDFGETIVLKPTLRACARFQLRPEAGGRFDPRCLVDRTTTIDLFTTDPFSGTSSARGLRVDENLEIVARRLQCGQSYGLRLELPPYAPAFAGSPALAPGEIRTVDVVLREGISVGGRIVDEDGRSVDRARLRIHSEIVGDDGATRDTHQYVTSEEGSFLLEGGHAGLTRIEVLSNDFLPREIPRSTLGAGPDFLDLEIVLSRGGSIDGVLRVPDGRPVSDSHVSCTSVDENGKILPGSRHVATDESGRFAITGLDVRRHHLHTMVRLDAEALEANDDVVQPTDERPGWERLDWIFWHASRTDVPTGTSGIELILAGPPGLEGIVVDDDGDPVTDFTVHAKLDRGRPGAFPEWAASREQSETFSPSDGRFSWPELPAGNWYVSVEAEGFPSMHPLRIELPGTEDPLRIVLRRVAAIEGVVLDPDGEPVHRAQVTATQRSARAWRSDTTSVARTDREGRFRIEGIEAERVGLLATKGGFAPNAKHFLDVLPHETVDGVVLRLQRGGALSIDVVDEAGNPARHAEVWLDGRAQDSWRKRTTDEEGHLAIRRLAPGEYRVSARIAPGPPHIWRTPVTVRDGETTEVTLGGPKRIAVTVHGRVTAAGRPMGDIAVVAWPQAVEGESGWDTTGPEGRFTIELTAGGATRFHVYPRDQGYGGHWYEEELPASGEAEVVFEVPAGGIRGRVTREGGKRLPSFLHVFVEPQSEGGVSWTGGERHEARVADDGRWSCLLLAPGRYRVRAGELPTRVEGSPSAAPALRTDVLVREGEITEGIDLVLGRSGIVRGTVRDVEGSGVSDAWLYVRDEAGRALHHKGHGVDLGGRFSISGLPLGPVLVEAVGRDRATTAPRAVEVRAGEVVTLDLELGPATIVTLDLGRHPLDQSGFVVSLRDAEGREYAGTLAWRAPRIGAEPLTTRRFGPLPPGRWIAEGRLSDGGTARVSFELSGESERTVILPFPRP